MGVAVMAMMQAESQQRASLEARPPDMDYLVWYDLRGGVAAEVPSASVSWVPRALATAPEASVPCVDETLVGQVLLEHHDAMQRLAKR